MNHLFEAMTVNAVREDTKHFSPVRWGLWGGQSGQCRSRGDLCDLDMTILLMRAHFHPWWSSTQKSVHGFGDIVMNREVGTIMNLNEHVERWRRFAFEHSFLGAASSGFFITKSH